MTKYTAQSADGKIGTFTSTQNFKVGDRVYLHQIKQWVEILRVD